MYEYKVLTLKVKQCEKKFNELAQKGWRVIAVTPNQAMGVGVVAVLERAVKE